MVISLKAIYGRPSASTFQARGWVHGEPRAYNVVVFGPLTIPRWILVRRSSWAGREGDRERLPIGGTTA